MHRLAALWEPMSLGRPCDSAEAVRSFTKRGSAIDARLHTYVRATQPAQYLQLPLRTPSCSTLPGTSWLQAEQAAACQDGGWVGERGGAELASPFVMVL